MTREMPKQRLQDPLRPEVMIWAGPIDGNHAIHISFSKKGVRLTQWEVDLSEQQVKEILTEIRDRADSILQNHYEAAHVLGKHERTQEENNNA